MRQVSISELSELTGHDRRTITKSIDALPFREGEKGAHLYESETALAAIYAGDSLTAAKTRQANSQASLNGVKEEELRRTRLPIEDLRMAFEEIQQSTAAILKKLGKGEVVTPEKINEILGKFRDASEKMKCSSKI